MSTIGLAELLQQDINELRNIIDNKFYNLTEKTRMQTRGIITNLEDHLEELIEESIN